MAKKKITRRQYVTMMTIDACEALFPDDFTVGDVLSVAETLALRAIVRVPKEKRGELAELFINDLTSGVCELEEKGS